MATKSGQAGKKTRKGKNGQTDPVINFTIEPDSGNYHKMVIEVAPPNGITRVETAIRTPSGSIGLQRARKIDQAKYESVIHSGEAGEFRISIAAYGRRSLYGLLDSRYTIAIPNGHATAAQKKGKTSTIDIPPPPSEIRKRARKTFPISSAYAKALQNPNFSISNSYSNLKDAKLLTNPNVKFKSYIFGSGNFGAVFKLDLTGKFQALKCFTRAAPDIAERYYYLSSYLTRVSLPFLVNFNYLSKAVRVISNPKEFYPALLMDWVEGENVNQFIGKNLGNPDLILTFASNFIRSVSMMQMAGIAHGDLSGDNIIVRGNGDLTFIDYDGMFIPNLAGRGPPEKGHENFQHPAREREYSEKLDNFASLVIFLTAMAVSEDRSIWDYNNSDMDRLIFTSADFKNPGSSPVINKLHGMSRGIRKLTSILEEFLQKDPLWDGASPSVLMNL